MDRCLATHLRDAPGHPFDICLAGHAAPKRLAVDERGNTFV